MLFKWEMVLILFSLFLCLFRLSSFYLGPIAQYIHELMIDSFENLWLVTLLKNEATSLHSHVKLTYIFTRLGLWACQLFVTWVSGISMSDPATNLIYCWLLEPSHDIAFQMRLHSGYKMRKSQALHIMICPWPFCLLWQQKLWFTISTGKAHFLWKPKWHTTHFVMKIAFLSALCLMIAKYMHVLG